MLNQQHKKRLLFFSLKKKRNFFNVGVSTHQQICKNEEAFFYFSSKKKESFVVPLFFPKNRGHISQKIRNKKWKMTRRKTHTLIWNFFLYEREGMMLNIYNVYIWLKFHFLWNLKEEKRWFFVPTKMCCWVRKNVRNTLNKEKILCSSLWVCLYKRKEPMFECIFGSNVPHKIHWIKKRELSFFVPKYAILSLLKQRRYCHFRSVWRTEMKSFFVAYVDFVYVRLPCIGIFWFLQKRCAEIFACEREKKSSENTVVAITRRKRIHHQQKTLINVRKVFHSKHIDAYFGNLAASAFTNHYSQHSV